MYGACTNASYRPVPPPQFYTNTLYAPAQNVPDYNDSYQQQPSYSAVWLFCDIETSCLNPLASEFGILEIAAVITNDDLIVIDKLHVIINQPESVLCAASKWCQNHFGSRVIGGNDLFCQCRASGISEKQAGEMLKEFIIKHAAHRLRPVETNFPRRTLLKATAFGDPLMQLDHSSSVDPQVAPTKLRPPPPPPPQQDTYRVMLAGCSVYFDRHVLLTRYPFLLNYIGHKTIDMTSLLEVARRFRPDLLTTLRAPTGSHRALIDINESINILRWFNTAILMK